MDDLDLEQLKQELNGVSGGSVYDVDEIMREAGSDASKGSGTSLEELMKSLGIEMEESHSTPQEQPKTEPLKTRLMPESDRTQPVGKAAPVTEDMMPAWQGKEDLSALFLAAEQTQALVDEQDAMAGEKEQEEETNPFEEQDNVFAQLFAQLGEIEQEEKPADPRLTEPFLEPEEEPDLMARLFQPAEDLLESQAQPVEESSAGPEEPEGTRPFESVWDSATRVMEQAEEPKSEAVMEASESDGTELLTQNIDAADTYDAAEAYDEDEEAEDESEDEEEAEEEKPRRGFFARLFGASEADEEESDEEEDSEEEPEEEYDEDEDAYDTEDEDASDEYEEEETEPEDEAEDGEDFEEEEIEETDEEEEQPKRGFFARLFGASEADKEESDEEEEYDEEEDESDEAFDEESEEEYAENEEADAFDEEDGEYDEETEESEEEMPEDTESDAEEQVVETEPEEMDETQAFDVLSEQETQRIILPSAGIAVAEQQPTETETEVLTESSEEPEEADAFEEAEEEPEDSEAAQEEASEEETQPKQGFLNRLMDVFGLEIVEEEMEDTESDTESDAAEEAEEPQASEEQWYDPEDAEAESAETIEADEPEADPENESEEEMDPAEEEFRDILQREEEIGAEEETLSVPRPRPEDTPVISEEELAAFLSDVDEEEEEVEKVSFEQLLRDNGIDVDAEPEEQKLSLEEFPEEETTVYVDVPIRVPSAEASEDRQPELFDAEAELEAEEPSADHMEAEPEGKPAEEPEEQMEAELDEEPDEESEEDLEDMEVPEEEEPEEEQPEPDPDWLNLPLEELYQIAPSMAVLRREGPVMAREVLRQKEWIMARIRRYKDEQNGTPQEEPEEEPEQPEPAEPQEDVDAIHAADELHALLEQDAEDDSVFPERPTDKPETEAAGRKEMIVEVTATVRKQEQDAENEEPEPQEEEQPEPQPEQKKRKPKAAAGPVVQIPKNLNQESKACRRRAGKQARRASVIAVLTLICIYISCAADFSLLPLPDAINYVYHPDNVLIVFLVLMGLSMLLAYDVVWDGIQALIRLQPNLSTLIDLAIVLNIAHCITRLVSEGEEIPYACIVMLVLFAQLRAQVSHSTILHYTYKVAGNAREPMGLFYHDGPEPHLVKVPLENTDAFIAQTLKRGIRHKMESIFTILSVVIAVVLAVIVCVATGDLGRLIYVLAATVTGACQIALICAMVMARSYSARRMQRCGAAADDNLGVQYLAKAETVVLTDEDLFPASSIALERLELRSNLNDATALAYAAALMGETSLGHMLAEEVRTRYGAPLVARHVVEDVNGGVSGQVGGIQVLLGDDRYMAEHGIIAREIPEHALVLALDGDVAAVLVIDYQVPAALFNAMQELTERKIHIWLHTRNHQITPELVEQKYALKPGIVTVPDLETDRALRSPQYTAHDRLCGILARDGFIPLSGCMTSAREEARIAPVGIIIGVCAALLCILLMTYLCYVFVPEDAHPIRVLIYMILCFIPIFFLENGIGKE